MRFLLAILMLVLSAATQAQPERFASQGLDAAPSTPEQFGAHIRTEIEKWARIAKSANIKAE